MWEFTKFIFYWFMICRLTSDVKLNESISRKILGFKHTHTKLKTIFYFYFWIQSILQSHFTHNSNQHGLADVYQGSNNMAKF